MPSQWSGGLLSGGDRDIKNEVIVSDIIPRSAETSGFIHSFSDLYLTDSKMPIYIIGREFG